MRVPVSTYRIQFNPGFRFRDAQDLLPYLELLGITDVYASPLLQARHGSTHGYDVTNPLRLNPELGHPTGFDRMVRDLQSRRMGLLLDIVPNHMAASSENAWYMDVLEKGAYSPYAYFFDVDWHSLYAPLHGKILVPFLGMTYGRALESRQLELRLHERGFSLHYGGLALPLDPRTYVQVLSPAMEILRGRVGATAQAFRDFRGLMRMLQRLAEAPWPETGMALEDARRHQWELYTRSPDIRRAIDDCLRQLNGKEGDPHSFDALDRLLLEQNFWLAYWRLANERINYRRFFAVSDLISVRVEDQAVFDVTHSLILRLIREKKVTGLRVDHIDGLYDPARYLHGLQRAAAADSGGPFYVLVEKILGPSEELPTNWPIAGTTGYDFLSILNGIFVDAAGIRDLDAAYMRLIGHPIDFPSLVYEKKKLIMQTLFAGEMATLGDQLARLAGQDRYARDLPPRELEEGLLEITACVPVYRTYVDSVEISQRDLDVIERALQEAKRRNPGASPHIYEFVRRLLTLERSAGGPDVADRLNFVMRWQQFTGPIMAKGVEDTALFIYNRLLSENEVGSDPTVTGEACNGFHRAIRARQQAWPDTMNATTTHDTKRGEDVRARINVLSEMPGLWERRAERWRRWNAPLKGNAQGIPAPGPNDEIHIYQTMLGAWPLDKDEIPAFKDRLNAYMIKASREAKIHTNWTRPNPDYEAAVQSFIERIMSADSGRFLADFLRFERTVAYYGAMNSLAQTLLKIGCPGVPDTYQGSELWDLRLTDPDNRSPVDFRKRRAMLAELQQRAETSLATLPGELMDHWQDGRIKLYTIWRALQFRKEHAELFQEGEYLPAGARGHRKNNICAFARCRKNEWALVVVPRFLTGLISPGERPVGRRVWGHSILNLPEDAPSQWTNIFTGKLIGGRPGSHKRTLPLAEVFAGFPVALLQGQS